MPTATAQPAIGLAISKPVASSTPSWRLGPPINWISAPGMAHRNSDCAMPGTAPALMVAT